VAIQIHDLAIHLSGGLANTDPALSLGGIMAAASVRSQLTALPTNVTGVTIVNAESNAFGGLSGDNGTLTFTQVGSTLTWSAAGESSGLAVAVAADGRYTLESGTTGHIVVDVVFASLPVADQTDADITVSANANGIFDDISKIESLNGMTDYRCLYVKNESTVDTMLTTTIWLATQPPGADTLALMVDIAGVGDGVITGIAQVIADENTTPSTGAFTPSADLSAGISIGALAPGEAAAFWLERTMQAGNLTATVGDTSVISIQALT